MRIKSLAAVVALSLASASFAQTAAEPEFTAERFRSHVAFLADDLLEGRDTGRRFLFSDRTDAAVFRLTWC